MLKVLRQSQDSTRVSLVHIDGLPSMLFEGLGRRRVELQCASSASIGGCGTVVAGIQLWLRSTSECAG